MIKFPKKFTLDDLRNDLAKSCDLGITIEVRIIWKKNKNNEILNIKFKTKLLWTNLVFLEKIY